jgi:hypothetical protein
MWTRGSSSWAAGPQYSGWSPSEIRQGESTSNLSNSVATGMKIGNGMVRTSQDDQYNCTDMSGGFGLPRPLSNSEEMSFRSNAIRNGFTFPSERHDSLPHGHEDRSLSFGGTRMLQLALNQARPVRNTQATQEWSSDIEHMNTSDRFDNSMTASGSPGWTGFGFSPGFEHVAHLNADSQTFMPTLSAINNTGSNIAECIAFESPQVIVPRGSRNDDFLRERYCADMGGFSGNRQSFSPLDDIDLSRHQTPVQNVPRRLFANAGKENGPIDSPSFDVRKWASPLPITGQIAQPFTFLSPGTEREFSAQAQPTLASMRMAGPIGFGRQVELFGGSGPSYKPDCEERIKSPSAQCPSPPQAIPSPMPPKPKVVQMSMNVSDETLLEDVAGIDRKTCDALLLNTLVYMVCFP